MPGRRTIHSKKAELIKQSREAALNAIQTFNNPLITFKSQTYIVLMIIAWTYLLHAWFRQEGVDFRYYQEQGRRRRYIRVEGSIKLWELGKCLNHTPSPLDEGTLANLKFLIALRNRVEHEMVSGLDDAMISRYQACALNYCHYVGSLFGEANRIDHMMAYSLQLSHLTGDQIMGRSDDRKLPEGLESFVTEFESGLSAEAFNSPQYAVKLKIVRETVNNRANANAAVSFVDYYSDLGEAMAAPNTIVARVERNKHLAKDVVAQMQAEGFIRFRRQDHIDLWKEREAKRPDKGYAIKLGPSWFWYDNWVIEVRAHCEANRERFS